MEKPVKTNTQALNLEIRNIGIELFQYNQLTPYTISDAQITDWSKSLLELIPELTANILKKLIDGMKTTKYPFDKNIGIQNIFIAYNHYLGKYRTKLDYGI